MSRPLADENGRNFFHAIAAVGQLKLATRTLSTTTRKLVIGGLTAKDKQGRTPLHLAAYEGHLRVLRVFADAAPEAMNIRDQDGNTVKEALRRPNASVVGNPEDTRYFQRMVAIDKLGFTFNEFPFGPADVWDLAVSNTSTAVIVQPTWGNGNRMLYLSTKGTMMPVDLGPGNVPRYVANSNLHTLVLTEDKCFAWGKNVNGILGLETDGKTVHSPEPLSENFVQESRSFEKNVFSALGGTAKTEIKDPLLGVACCDFHSTCCTTTKVWAWGANRGQMMGKALKNTIVESPIVVFESTIRIRSVACTDNALVVLLSNGHVMLLHNDRIIRLVISKGKADGESVAAKGNYLVVQTNQGKLLRFTLNNIDEPTTIWASRRPKDAILAFDLSENGAVIVATRAGVYKVEEGRELTEMKDIKGLQFTTMKTDSHFRSFVGVQRIVAGLAYHKDATPVQERYPEISTELKWGRDENTFENPDMHIRVGDASVPVHKALIYARCPTLRPLLDKNSDVVAAPGGSAICRLEGFDLKISNVPLEAVKVFVQSLRYASCSTEDLCLENNLEQGPELHEYLALRRFVTRDLGEGLWEARLAGIGCDVEINGNLMAHSSVLTSTSPVLAAHLERWHIDNLLSDTPARVLEQVLRFSYTKDLSSALVAQETGHSKVEQAQYLFELWQIADELLMPCLSSSCEQKLFEMLDFDLVGPLLHATSDPADAPTTKLRSSLLDIVARYMDFFWSALGEFDNNTMDSLESALKIVEGTENVDQALADSFEALKLLSQSGQSQSLKKKKAPTVSPSGTSSMSSSVIATKPASTIQSPLSAKAASSGALENQSIATPVSRNNEGWIQARRKSRTSSQANQEKSGSVAKTLGMSSSASPSASTPSPITSSSSSSPSPSISVPRSSLPTTSVSSTTSTSASLNSRGKAPAPVNTALRPTKASPSQPVELPRLGRSVPKQESNKLGTLPALPTLGSQPAQRAGSAGRSSRPKFNQKDRKKLQQFEDPFALVQQFENKTPANSSPWKQVTVASSQSVLERLERVHQINNKRTSNGSVWGV